MGGWNDRVDVRLPSNLAEICESQVGGLLFNVAVVCVYSRPIDLIVVFVDDKI